MSLGWYETVYLCLPVVYILRPLALTRRVARHPHKFHLADYYQATTIVLSSLLAEANFVHDSIQRMVEESLQVRRALIADRCRITFVLAFGNAFVLFCSIRLQRLVDPKGEGRGWKRWAFMIASNLIAVIILGSILFFLKQR